MMEWRMKDYERWIKMEEKKWERVDYKKIDFKEEYYY